MKITWKRIALALVAAWGLLYAVKPAWALKPLSVIGAIISPQASCPIPSGSNGIWVDSGTPNVLKFRLTGGSDTSLGAGGGGVSWPLTNSTSTNTYTSAVADGASAVGHSFDVTNAFNTSGDAIVEFKNAGTRRGRFWWDNGNAIEWFGGPLGDAAIGYQGNTMWFSHNGAALDLVMLTSAFRSVNDVSYALGDSTHRWTSNYSAWYDTKLGAQLTAAATITPTVGLHHVTGATTINIIALTNVPSGGNVYITLIADSTINLGTSASAGGIKIAPTAITSGKAMTFILDQATSLWYPVQGA